VGKPETARKKSGHDFFFVNGRYMRHPYFHKAVITAYDRLIPEGMQTPYFLYIDVDPAAVDVNIHPTKTEIKFENEQAIWQVLTATVRDALGRFCDIPAIDFDVQGKPDIPVFDPSRDNISAPKVTYNPDYNPFSTHNEAHKSTVPSNWEQLYDSARSVEGSHLPPSSFHLPSSEGDLSLFPAPEGNLSPLTSSDFSPLEGDMSPSHYQYKGRLIMTAVKSGLMVIDQHRADVRIRYERYMQQLENHTAPSQQVLFPETIRFSASEAVILDKLLPGLTAIGFDLTDLGAHTFAINGVPADIDGINPVTLLQQILADSDTLDIPTDSSLPTSDSDKSLTSHLSPLTSKIALQLAQSVAIPYGQVLSNDEMDQLVNELFTCSNVNYTPNGKPILAILPQADIDHLLDGKG
jgi:DNA mismatch repair protein MutL